MADVTNNTTGLNDVIAFGGSISDKESKKVNKSYSSKKESYAKLINTTPNQIVLDLGNGGFLKVDAFSQIDITEDEYKYLALNEILSFYKNSLVVRKN